MTALRRLDLSFTKIIDLDSSLETLTALESLDLRHTAVSDLVALAGLKSLRILRIGRTKDTSALTHMKALHIDRS